MADLSTPTVNTPLMLDIARVKLAKLFRGIGRQLRQPFDDPIGPGGGSKALNIGAMADTRQDQDRLHPDRLSAGDVALQIVAHQNTSLRCSVNSAAQLVEEQTLGLAAVDG